jgi:hypothetical protein
MKFEVLMELTEDCCVLGCDAVKCGCYGRFVVLCSLRLQDSAVKKH